MTKNDIKIRTRTILMVSAFAFVISTVSLTPAFAHSPGYTHDVWFQYGGQPEMCYLEYQLKEMTVNGSTNNEDLVETAVEATRAHYNSKIDGLTIDGEYASCSFNRIEVGAKDLGWGINAMAQRTAYYPNPNYGQYAEMEIDFNTGKNWQINNLNCGAFDDLDPRWLANHEFGHALSLGHHSSVILNHSVMSYACTDNYDAIQPDDEAALEARYS